MIPALQTAAKVLGTSIHRRVYLCRRNLSVSIASVMVTDTFIWHIQDYRRRRRRLVRVLGIEEHVVVEAGGVSGY